MNNTEFKLKLDSNFLVPMYKNRLHKFLCKFIPFIFKPNKDSFIDSYSKVKLQVLSHPKAVKTEVRNPWYKFWLPKYTQSSAFSYEVKIVDNE